MKTKTILITGGDGFTGRQASKYFNNRGYNVYTTSRKIKNNYTFKINLIEQENVFEMIKQLKPDYILHLSGQNDVQLSWHDPHTTFEANVFVTLNIIEAVRQCYKQVKVVVVGSILEEDITNTSFSHPYGLSKALQTFIANRWVDYFGLNIVTARPVNLIGPGYSNGVCAQFAKQIAFMEQRNKSVQLTITNRDIKRDFLDVRDAVNAYEVLFQSGECGKTYDIGTGKSRTLLEVAKTYKQLSNTDVELKIKNNQLYETKLNVNPNPIMSLGWFPQYSLIESLTDCLNFYRIEPRKLND